MHNKKKTPYNFNKTFYIPIKRHKNQTYSILPFILLKKKLKKKKKKKRKKNHLGFSQDKNIIHKYL